MERFFDLQGHRGARALFPENTLEGFRRTRALGVTSIELDVAVTRDGVPVVTHDVRLNGDLMRGPDGKWLAGEGPLLRDMTFAELQTYDAGRMRPGSALAGRFARQVPIDGARVPRLADVLAALPDVMVDVEIKTLPNAPEATRPGAEMVDLSIAAAIAVDALPRIRIRAFDWRVLRHVRRKWPEIPVAWLTGRHSAADPQLWWGVPALSGIVAAVAEEAEGAPWRPVWAAQVEPLTEAEVAAAQAAGLLVVPWTVNAPADMARLIGWGVDGICTDAPDLLREAMRSRGIPLPPAP